MPGEPLPKGNAANDSGYTIIPNTWMSIEASQICLFFIQRLWLPCSVDRALFKGMLFLEQGQNLFSGIFLLIEHKDKAAAICQITGIIIDPF